MSIVSLAIETSNPSATPGSGAVAIVRTDEVGGDHEVDVEALGPASRHYDALVPAIARLCRRAGGWAPGIDRVCVSIGPGGYTALRIAVTTAKMIGEVSGAAVYGVPTCEALVRRVPEEARSGRPVAVLLAWKREDVWVAEYGPDGRWVGEGRIVGLDEVGVFAGHVLVGDDVLRRLLVERGVLGAEASWMEPVFDPIAVYEASAGVEPVDPADLLPLYPREPEAVRKWNSRGG